MSMLYDVAYTVVSFCKENGLDESKMNELHNRILCGLEWEYDDDEKPEDEIKRILKRIEKNQKEGD